MRRDSTPLRLHKDTERHLLFALPSNSLCVNARAGIGIPVRKHDLQIYLAFHPIIFVETEKPVSRSVVMLVPRHLSMLSQLLYFIANPGRRNIRKKHRQWHQARFPFAIAFNNECLATICDTVKNLTRTFAKFTHREARPKSWGLSAPGVMFQCAICARAILRCGTPNFVFV